jgi:hypothetical protein
MSLAPNKSEEDVQSSQEYKDLTKLPLQDFPVGVLSLIMANLSVEDAVRICGTTAKLRSICQRHDLVNRKAREFVAQQSPLSKPIINPLDQYDLIKRGFKTTYLYTKVKKGKPANISFGSNTSGLGTFSFNIIGLPPPKGTKVLLLYNNEDSSGYPVDVFVSFEAVEETVRNSAYSKDSCLYVIIEDYLYDNYMEDDLNQEVILSKPVMDSVMTLLDKIFKNPQPNDSWRLKEIELP